MALWGVSATGWPWVLAFMATVHVPAEELFWRGWIQSRIVGDGSPSLYAGARIALISLLYASYHAVTLFSLVPQRSLAGVMFVGVWLAGLLWGWLRWRTGGIWLPLVAHGAAVAAYVAFVPPLAS
jgi:membrane protease YdiL (CAAX protease family)